MELFIFIVSVVILTTIGFILVLGWLAGLIALPWQMLLLVLLVGLVGIKLLAREELQAKTPHLETAASTLVASTIGAPPVAASSITAASVTASSVTAPLSQPKSPQQQTSHAATAVKTPSEPTLHYRGAPASATPMAAPSGQALSYRGAKYTASERKATEHDQGEVGGKYRGHEWKSQ